ncbi:RYamide neuropeptides-like isoform X2 [Coccinella septempunctata]|nr:RYamide neuropeptides-like isoform X2 [Coccinella septempunctata]
MNVILLIIGILISFLSYNEAILTTRYGKKNINSGEIRPRSINNVPSFFVGPRYGKRMAWSPGENELSSPLPCTTFEDLSCDYTGISDYYRCYLRRDQDEEDNFSDSN